MVTNLYLRRIGLHCSWNPRNSKGAKKAMTPELKPLPQKNLTDFIPFKPCDGNELADDWEFQVWDRNGRPFLTIHCDDGELASSLRKPLAEFLNALPVPRPIEDKLREELRVKQATIDKMWELFGNYCKAVADSIAREEEV
jgi:hypothetical protein